MGAKEEMIVSIDPGIRGCGVACFSGKLLSHAEYLRNPAQTGDGIEEIFQMSRFVRVEVLRHKIPDLLVVEWPQVYQGSKQKGDPNDLLTLAGVDAAIVSMFPGVPAVRYRPREWKGQLPPNVCARRVYERLTPDERWRVKNIENFEKALAKAESSGKEIGGVEHNTFDAIGIGLKYLGRFEANKVIAR